MHPMSSLDFEREGGVHNLETDWRRAQEAVTVARADLERVLGCCKANGGLIDVARIRLQRAEAREAHIFTQIEHLRIAEISPA
jgi:hypothetical protein